MTHRTSIGVLATLLLLLAGCATPSADQALDPAAQLAHARHGASASAKLLATDAQRQQLAAQIQQRLSAPLDLDAAVSIAITNHPGLQATYWDAGIAQAEVVQAARLRNPGFGFSSMQGGGEREIERGLSLDIAGLFTMPLRQRLAARQYDETVLRVAAAIEEHLLETRRAWVEAVAAQETLTYMRQVADAADASTLLVTRMAEMGSANALELARAQALHAQASQDVLRASRASVQAREKLTRQLGLWGEQANYQLPTRLPDLPQQAHTIEDVEARALRQRIDVEAARAAAAATAADLGLTRTTRMVNVLELGYGNHSETGVARKRGWEVTLELPLFDWGGARVARAEAVYMQAVNRVAQVAIDARSHARAAYLDYRASFEAARHYADHVIPLRKKIADETLLRYNGMLLSTFDLLEDAREQAASVNAALEAYKDFWLAHIALEEALGASVPHPANDAQHHHEHMEH